MKKLILFLLAVAASLLLSQAQSGELKGVVTDISKEPIPFANVAVYRENVLVTGGVSDIDGNYSIKPIKPGSYCVEMSSVGYTKKRYTGVAVDSGAVLLLDGSLEHAEIIVCFMGHSYDDKRTIYRQRTVHGSTRIAKAIKKQALKRKRKKSVMTK